LTFGISNEKGDFERKADRSPASTGREVASGAQGKPGMAAAGLAGRHGR